MTDNIIEPDTFNGNTPKDQPDGIKARERLILEAARSLANALGITKNIGDDMDVFTAFLNQVHRLEGATSDEWTWPSDRPLMDFKAHFFDMEEPLMRLKAGRETLVELSIGGGTIPREVVGFMADSLVGPVSWIDRLFYEAYRKEPPESLQERVAAREG